MQNYTTYVSAFSSLSDWNWDILYSEDAPSNWTRFSPWRLKERMKQVPKYCHLRFDHACKVLLRLWLSFKLLSCEAWDMKATRLLICLPAQHYLHGRVDGRVCSQAEVCAGHVVADGGGDDAHGDAELLVAVPCFKQLQHTFVGLWNAKSRGVNDTQSFGKAHNLLLKSAGRFIFFFYLKASNDEQGRDLELGEGLYHVIHEFVWKGPNTMIATLIGKALQK